jgi:hypothetical protein
VDRLTVLLNAPRALRRAVALLVLAVSVAAAAGFVWLTIGSLADEAAEVRAKREMLGNLQSIIALKQALTDHKIAIAEATSGPEFLHGTSEAVVRGNLQSRLVEIAGAHGVRVFSVGNTPIRQRENVRYAGLRAVFSGTNEEVHAILFAIETSKPFLVIREASIRSTLNPQATPQKGPGEIVIQIQFDGALPPEGGERRAGE